MKTGIELIAEERAAQVAREGWTVEHDDEHSEGEMASAAASYALCACEQAMGWDGLFARPGCWPWDTSWFKPKDQLRNLVRAGALIAAEIDRVQRCNALINEGMIDAMGGDDSARVERNQEEGKT